MAADIIFKVIMVGGLLTLVSNMISWTLGGVEVLDEAEFTKKTKLLGHRHAKYDTPDYSYLLMGTISTLLIQRHQDHTRFHLAIQDWLFQPY
jgi:amino acid transporter